MEYEDGTIGQHTAREPRDYSNPGETINWPVKGVIVNVLATDDPNNGQGQILCDVSLIDYGYTLFRLQVMAPHFHQETRPDATLSRQRAAARSTAIFDGESWTPRVGSICLVQFIGPPGPTRDAVITAFGPVSNQSLPSTTREPSDNIFPREAQAVTVFDSAGVLKEEYRSRLHPTHSESPRYTRSQNGSVFEIDNRGNINLQSTISREQIEREVYDDYDYSKPRIDSAPAPEGNIVLSTRGAPKGNIALATGKIKSERRTLQIFDASGNAVREIVLTEALDEQNEEGNVLVQTSYAKQGNVTHDLTDAEQGNYTVRTGKQQGEVDSEGDILLETLNALRGNIKARTKSKEGKITLDTTEADSGDIELAAKGDIEHVVEAGEVRLGLRGASHPTVRGDDLLLWVIEVVMSHFHYGVESGRSITGPPNITPPDMLSEKVLVSE